MTPAEQIALYSRWLDGTDIELLDLTNGQDTIRLRRDPAGFVAPVEAEPDSFTIRAPSLGLFRLEHPARPGLLVQPGHRAEAGDPVGVLQIGALLVHVAAPHAGTVLDILAEDGAAVGYGAPLIRLTAPE